MTKKIIVFFLSSFIFLAIAFQVKAMPIGTLLYRSSSDGNIYGGSTNDLVVTNGKMIEHLYTGHVGIYVGREDGVDYVVEALPGGLLKVPAKYFINSRYKEKFLGAKIPKEASPEQRLAAADLALAIAEKNWRYDFDFKKQKGPGGSDFVCVGLTEKVYESANLSNPYDLNNLVYDRDNYAIDITPDGFDNTSIINNSGDCFSQDKEFSKISPKQALIAPAPEIWGYDAGLENDGERYFFLPYTQFLQDSLEDVVVDIELESDFIDEDIRGKTPKLALIFKWSLINNPLSSIKSFARAIASWFSVGSSLALETDIPVMSTSTKLVSDPVTAVKEKYSFASALKPSPVTKKNVETIVKKTDKIEDKESVKIFSNIISAVLPRVVTKKNVKEEIEPFKPVANNYTTVINNNVASSSSPLVLPPKILISRLYSFGDDDAIELYNPGSESIDLSQANFRLEKAKTTNDPNIIFRFNTPSDLDFLNGSEIAAGGYYLIVSQKATSSFQDKADAIAKNTSFILGNSGYTIYLGTDAISSFDDKNIVDMLGYGPEAIYVEGTGAASAIASETQFLARKARIDSLPLEMQDGGSGRGMAYDSQNNAEDFLLIDLYQEDATNTDSMISTSTDDIIATSTDSVVSSSTSTLEAIVINRLHATGDNDYVELYNPNNIDLDLAELSFRLEKAKTASDPAIMAVIGKPEDGVFPGGTKISADGKYLIVNDLASDELRSQAQAIISRPGVGFGSDGYTIYLSVGPVSSNTDEDIVDMVGFGEATYYSGLGPAPVLGNDFALARHSFSGNNNQDFVLEPELWANSFTATDIGQKVSGISHLWHFNECVGTSSADYISNEDMTPMPNFIAAKWGCGYEHYGQAENPKTVFPTTDLGTFSIVTTFRQRQWARFGFNMSHVGNSGSYSSIIFDENFTELCGFPGGCERIDDLKWPGDNLWHQAALVVNSPEDYLEIYLDGQVVYHRDFQAIFSKNFDAFRFYGGNGWTDVDETATFSRALSATELEEIYLADKPFSPYMSREEQKPFELLAYFSFDERQDAKALDSLGTDYFNLPSEGLWIKDGYKNGAIFLDNSSAINVSANINSRMIATEDISISFFYQNRNAPDQSRLGVRLDGELGNILGLYPMENRLSYDFSGVSYIYEPPDGVFPIDNNWHHMAYVYDSYKYQLNFYVDGQLKMQKLLPWFKPDIIKEVYISNGWNAPGIDELKIWRGVLNEKNIASEL